MISLLLLPDHIRLVPSKHTYALMNEKPICDAVLPHPA